VSGGHDDLLHFVAASFPSVWALELLLTLKAERRAWPQDDLVAKLRASELVVSKALDALVVAGLASVDPRGATYSPVNAEVDSTIERVEQLYRRRPNAVRRAIVSAQTGSAAAFADAFKLRRNDND
jgi:hypothetical protein